MPGVTCGRMPAKAVFMEQLRAFLLDRSFTFDRAANLIDRGIEVAARTSMDSTRDCVEHAYAQIAPTHRRAAGLRELREVAKGAELASALEHGVTTLDAALSDGSPYVARRVVRRALRLGRFSELARVLSGRGDAVGALLPWDELEEWGHLRSLDCATLLSTLGVRHPLVFSEMARADDVAGLREAANIALSIAPSNWNGGRDPYRGSQRTVLPWALEAIVTAAATAGHAALGLELAEASSRPEERGRLRASIALTAGQHGDPSFARTLLDEGGPFIEDLYRDSFVSRLNVWCTIEEVRGDIAAAAWRMQPRVKGTCFLASELVAARRGRDAVVALSTLAGTEPEDFYDVTIGETATELCDEGLFAEAADLVRSTQYAPYVAHRAAWANRTEVARAIDSGDAAAALAPLIAFREGRPVGRVARPVEESCFALLFELEQRHGWSTAVGQGTAAFPEQPFRPALSTG
jgi:hypothetical protein